MERVWQLKRNCSLTPRQVGMAYGALGMTVLLIGALFAARGLWMVLVFAWVDVLGIALAVLYYARHANDGEEVALSAHSLRIERSEAGAVHQVTLDPYWTRIRMPSRSHALIGLESRGAKVEIGAFIGEAQRRAVALALRRALRDSSGLV